MNDLLTLSKLKKGQTFGARGTNGNWLYCSIESIKNGIIEAGVINGCWGIKFDLKTLKSIAPYEGSTIVYNKKIVYPKDMIRYPVPYKEYNDAIYVMEDEYNKVHHDIN